MYQKTVAVEDNFLRTSSGVSLTFDLRSYDTSLTTRDSVRDQDILLVCVFWRERRQTKHKRTSQRSRNENKGSYPVRERHIQIKR